MRTFDPWVKAQYPELVAVAEKEGGDPKLQAKHAAICEEMAPLRQAIKDYDAEQERGIMHTPAYQRKMADYLHKLVQLEKDVVVACDAWRATWPTYDPDNHIGSCGCIIKDGKNVHWCGDHY